MTALVQDTRYALRTLLSQPSFTVVVILTLALGIGANTAIFSVIHGVLLKPLPFVESDRLYLAYQSMPERGNDTIPLSPANFADWRRESELLEDLVAFNSDSFNLTGGDEGTPDRISGIHVSAGYFDLMRSPLAWGRGFLPEEDAPGAPAVVVLSHRLWQSRFGGDSAIVGTAIELNGELHTVVGVGSDGFNFPNGADLWTPNRFDSSIPRDDSFIMALGRLGPGVTEAAAAAELKQIAAQLEAAYPDLNQGVTAKLVSLQERIVARIRPALLLLSGAVAFVLLIACANVASLLLSRATTRRKEVAIRLALGAGRPRLLRQFLTESVLLSVTGGILGVLFAAWGTDALVTLYGSSIPRASAIDMNTTVLGFALGISMLTGLILTLVPSFRLREATLGDPLKEGGRGLAGGARDGRLRGSFVATQVALALMLLIGASLMLRSFSELTRVDLGFQPDGLLTFELNLPAARYETDRQLVDFYDAALDRIRMLPGVETAAAIYPLPLMREFYAENLLFEGRPRPEPAQMPVSHVRMVSPDYFETMAIPIVQGRTLTADDQRAGAPVVIVNRAIVKEHFADQSPIGNRLAIFDSTSDDEPRWLDIVGVVADVRHDQLSHLAEPEIYLSLGTLTSNNISLVVRSAAGITPMADLIRQEIVRIDPELPLYNVAPMSRLVDNSLAQTRFLTALLAFFSAVALALAVIGVYGVLSYWVSQRTREIGIRMVLGVTHRHLTSMVVGQGMLPVLLGVALGLGGALWVTRFLGSQLYGVSSTDPATFGAVALVLIAVAVAATLIPARRAAAVSPVVMLRDE